MAGSADPDLTPAAPEVAFLPAAAEQFCGQARVMDVRPHGSGNVHATFLVSLEGGGRFILQRVNTRVFSRPDLVMRNMAIVTEHLWGKAQRSCPGGNRRWEVPRVLPARDGGDHWLDPEGSFWRALRYVERSRSDEIVRDADQAREIGWALGTFHDLVSDVPPWVLADTLEGFHVTPLYLSRYEEVLAKRGAGRGPEAGRCARFVAERKEGAHVLENARTRGRLRLRPIHGDPKVNNVLFDESTGLAVALIDLDTVKPGLVHYDIGDCARSACNPLGEEAERWEAVRFEPDLGRALLEGYLSVAERFLTADDYEYIYDAIRLIAFELGLRFFTDYLEGNVYFRAEREEHNLSRALVQFRLTESIEAQETAIRAIIRDLRCA